MIPALLPASSDPDDLDHLAASLFGAFDGQVEVVAVEVMDHPLAVVTDMGGPAGPYLLGLASEVEAALTEGGWTAYRTHARLRPAALAIPAPAGSAIWR